MNTAPDFVVDPSARPATAQAPIASWYAQGVSDGLGDRLLMFDNTGAASLELLRFRPSLANAPGFERTLRETVQRLASFKHAAFTQARSLQRLEGDDGLALISTHVEGKRLSDMFRRTHHHDGMHPGFATWLIRQLTSALSDFHTQGDDIAHGALTADRIVLTPDRRLVMVEHVLGAALDERQFSPGRLWHDVGIITAATVEDARKLDKRGDIVQLGLVALSVLLGRRVTPDEYPRDLDRLLDEFAETSGKRSPTLVGPLRRWLIEALDPSAGFETALEAGESLTLLGHPGEHVALGAPPVIQQLQELPPVQPVAAQSDAAVEAVETLTLRRHPEEQVELATPPVIQQLKVVPPVQPVAAPSETPLEAGESQPLLGHPEEHVELETPQVIQQLKVVPPVQSVAAPGGTVRIAPERAAQTVAKEPAMLETKVVDMGLSSSIGHSESLAASASAFWSNAPAVRRFSFLRNVAIGLAALAVLEGIVIAQLLTKATGTSASAAAGNVPLTIVSPTPGDRVFIDGREVGVTPFKLSVASAPHAIQVMGRQSAPATPPTGAAAAAAGDPRTASAIAAAAQRQRSGGLRLSTPIDLQVLEGERVLGTSADGPIVASAGVHQLDFINTSIGFRSRQSVTIKAGEIVPLKIQPPDGRVSINAQPWAQVWIDGNLVGETPLANLTVSAGEHEIVFRHPQLGEHRETTIVKSGVQTRISTTLSK
ncbi:MAG TPA: PEGA domain-containing protein [Vicinamibacterales bacterium]